ncbi:MAG: PASTA domain-containing protein [Pyrinomonadaceae bacterium]
MSFVKSCFSAVGKFIIVLVLAGAFIAGLVSVVYMSLKGSEMQIPEVVGKDFKESETELAALGLKIRRIANRYSEEVPNTILEQRPRAGSTAKSGLMISVIVAQPNPEGSEAPAAIKKKTDDESDIEEIEEMISDKPKKSANKTVQTSNKKKASTSRDVIANKSSDNSNSDNKGNSNNSSKANSSTVTPATKDNKNTTPPKPATTPAVNPKKPAETAKPTSGDTRQRKAPPSN